MRETLTFQLDPYYLAPIGADYVSLAALQAQAVLAREGRSEKDLAEIVVQRRRDAVEPEERRILDEARGIFPDAPADAALATDTIVLLAWAATYNEGGLQEPELRWACEACCDVTAAAHQVHGAVGFALETGLHVYHRRARSVQAWTAAACAAAR